MSIPTGCKNVLVEEEQLSAGLADRLRNAMGVEADERRNDSLVACQASVFETSFCTPVEMFLARCEAGNPPTPGERAPFE
jgi:hypothetical protein